MKAVKYLSLILVTLMLVGCGKSTPTSVYNGMVKAAENKEWGKMYDSYSTAAKAQLDMSMKMVSQMSAAFAGMSGDSTATKAAEARAEELAELEGRALFIEVMKDMAEKEGAVKAEDMGEIVAGSEKIDGEKASLKVKMGDKEESMNFVLEDGKWKIAEIQ